MNRILTIERIDRFGRVTESVSDDAGETDLTGVPYRGTAAGRRKGGSLRVRITPEEGEPFMLSGRRAARLGLKPGAELPTELHTEILQSLRASCMQRCGTLLGSRDYSEHRLRTKLQEAGYPPSIIQECIEKLAQAHYLDDQRYAETYVRTHLRDRSSLRIRRDLAERGIAEEYIAAAFEKAGEEADTEEAQRNQIRRLLRRRGYDQEHTDFVFRQKTMAFLHRKGYAPEMIRQVMEERMEEKAEAFGDFGEGFSDFSEDFGSSGLYEDFGSSGLS